MSPFRQPSHGEDQELAEDRPNQIESGSSYNETPSKMPPSASSQALPRVTDFDMPRTESTSALSQWNGDLPVRRSLRTPNTRKVASSANESDVGSYAQLPNQNTSTHTLSITDPSPLSQRVSFGSPSSSTQSHSRRAPIPQSSSLTSISPFASSPGRRHQPIYFGAGTSPRRPSQHSPYRSPVAASNSIDESKRRKFESSSNAAIPVQFASPSSTSQLRPDASLTDSTPTRKRAAPGSSQRADDALRSIRAAVDVQGRDPANPTQTETSSPSSSSRPTRAATTMLSVLESSSPRIHTPPVPEVVNPYQTRSRASPKPATPQSTRAKALEAARHRASSSLSSSTARDTDAPPSASLLDMVQRTAPLSPSMQKHRSSLAHSTDQDPSIASQNSAESLDPPKIAWQHKPKRPSPLAMSEQTNITQKPASINPDQPPQSSSQKPSNAAFQFGKSQSSTNIASDLISKESSSKIPSSTELPTSPMANTAQQPVSSADSSELSSNPAKPSFSFSSAQKPRSDLREQPAEATKDTLPKTQQFSFGTQANVTPQQADQEPSPFQFKPKPAAASIASNAQVPATAPSSTTPAAATLSKDQKSAPSFSDLPWLHILPPSHPRKGPSNDAIAIAAAIAYERLPTFAFDVADALPVSLDKLTEDNLIRDSPSSAASIELDKDSQKGLFSHSNGAVKQIAKEPLRDVAKDLSSSQSFTTSVAQDKPSASSNFSFGEPSTAKPAGFTFGQASMPSSDATATENSSSKPLSGFSFRPPASSQPSSGFSFGKPQEESSRTEPKPSFSFLTPNTTSATPSSTQPKFSFGNASKAPSTFAPSAFASSASAPSTSTSSELRTETMPSEPQETNSAATSPPPPHTSEDKASDENTFTSSGQGEEDEETKHEVRAKIWKLDEGKWQDLGITVFRLKHNPSSNKTRVLARNAVNGNVVLNFHLYSGMKVTCEKTIVSFVGMIDAKPCSLRCKVKTNQAADALTQAINSHLP
ncbi:hypothetical protein MYAM1_002777 [Malassezia yamatoensis]|uniref:RanBD1 domain-containing protein n=1 Tax=Malassezia yamatoensis TaxID=253288 RepID=A0AAJ6CI91_9BASI|nr:hypothetical protein MYAM1_002777 [Malassezia yamatoensis]